MAKIHEVMYAGLVSSVDSVITLLDGLTAEPEPRVREGLREASGQLKSALLKAEELYVSAGEGAAE